MSEVKCTEAIMKKCKYACGSGGDSVLTCNYIVDTGHRRPCPPDKCTVFEEGKKPNRIAKYYGKR